MKSMKQNPFCQLCDRNERDGSSPRCATCKRLMTQASNTGATKGRTAIKAPEAQEAIRLAVQLGKDIYPDETVVYACHYSHIPLYTDKARSAQGDYASFDHAVPNDPSQAFLCSRIINDFKGLLTAGEFKAFVCKVMDLDAPRRLHGLDVAGTKEFLSALRVVMRGNEPLTEQARKRLKELSSKIYFERPQLMTPGETITFSASQ
jgi:hypothetical protein